MLLFSCTCVWLWYKICFAMVNRQKEKNCDSIRTSKGNRHTEKMGEQEKDWERKRRERSSEHLSNINGNVSEHCASSCNFICLIVNFEYFLSAIYLTLLFLACACCSGLCPFPFSTSSCAVSPSLRHFRYNFSFIMLSLSIFQAKRSTEREKSFTVWVFAFRFI